MSVHLENGRWYVRFQVGGTRVRKAIKEARTKKQAEHAERILRNEIFEKRWGESGQRNFAEFIETTYKPNARQHKRGFHVELTVLKALVDLFGQYRLGEITPQHVFEFQQKRASETTNRRKVRSRATVNRDMAVLSAVFKLAIRLGELKENPVSKIQYFGNLPKRDRVLSDDEEVTLLKALNREPDLRRKVEILLYTGLRRSELFRLQWRDVDFAAGVIRLRAETTKTGRSRTIPLLSNVRRILATMKEQERRSATDEIFEGGDAAATLFSARLDAVCERVGISGVTAHVLRHTFSTWANKFNVDPFAQKEALGHSKLSQTSDYTHQSGETLKRNFDGFEKHIQERPLRVS
jgi:integrase